MVQDETLNYEVFSFILLLAGFMSDIVHTVDVKKLMTMMGFEDAADWLIIISHMYNYQWQWQRHLSL